MAHLTLQEQVPAGPDPRLRLHLQERLGRPRMEPERRRYPRMPEVVFRKDQTLEDKVASVPALL